MNGSSLLYARTSMPLFVFVPIHKTLAPLVFVFAENTVRNPGQ